MPTTATAGTPGQPSGEVGGSSGWTDGQAGGHDHPASAASPER